MTVIITPRRRDEFFDKDGNFTHQAIRFFEDLTETTNESAAEISLLARVQAFNSQSQWLQKQIDGLPEFTIDTTGFTFDSTIITFDKVIA
jgi:hypothetical protein